MDPTRNIGQVVIYLTVDGQALYPGVEEKASNLLYFIIEDHPFVDGNQRTMNFWDELR
jgi:prophage maintenance system killer protein